MHINAYFLTITLSGLAFAVPQAAKAQAPIGESTWDADTTCPTYSIDFYPDGTANIVKVDSNTERVDDDDATWTLKGTDLSISYGDSRKAQEKWSGTYTGGKLQLVHSWADKDGSARTESCIFSEKKTNG